MSDERSRPTPIGDLVGPFLARRGLVRRIDLAGAVERWTEAVGPQVAAVTRAESVSGDGVLWVRTTSSAWAAELSMMAPRILGRLNHGRDGRITQLRFRVGPLEADR